MDINSLLAPQDTSAPEGASSPVPLPVQGGSPLGQKFNQGKRSTPRSQPHFTTSSHAVPQAQAQVSVPSPPNRNYQRQRDNRSTPTSGMDTLADLASMQHHQQTARAKSGGLRSQEPYESRLSAAHLRPSLQAIARTHSGSRSSLDIRMADAPTSTPPPRVFNTSALPEADLHLVSELVAYLAENGYAYESHVQLIKLLYRGFLSHVYPNSDSVVENDPATYDLLRDLRQAMEAMASRFSMGEELWVARIRVQQLIARSLDDAMGIVELCEKAVAEERGSSSLWMLYGDWMLSLYCTGNPADEGAQQVSKPLSSSIRLAEDDILAIREVFGRAQMLDVWKRGTDDTQYCMDKSHLLWNRYTDLLLQDINGSLTRESVDAFKAYFQQRLDIPHEAWDETFQKFSSFISTYDNANYEATMVSASQQGTKVKAQYMERSDFETQLQRTSAAEDKGAEWMTFQKYLDIETSRNRKKRWFSFDICNAIFQRAILRFPGNVDLWEDYIAFLSDDTLRDFQREPLVSVLGRACNHCPWSGTLWAQYIQAAELANLKNPFTDIGEIKHKATSTGLLDFGGMEEVLKIHAAWCSFLRRKAFQPNSSDEELDVAEVGIRSAIEDMETIGKAKYGKDYKGDPKYRLDRIYIKFLVQSRNYNAARDTWKGLIARHGSNYEFWIKYYYWEMVMWATLMDPENSAAPRLRPTEATRVLGQAVQRSDLDWPEKVIETYLSHCENHEDAAALQTAIFQCRKATKAVEKRREAEAEQAAEAAKQYQATAEAEISAEVSAESRPSKRKRDEDVPDELGSNKKNRSDSIMNETSVDDQEDTSVNQPELKRDRENSTIIVKNIPLSVTEKRVRNFFADCGIIKSIKIIPEDSGESAEALIEFDTKEDVLAAQTKDKKTLDGRAIEVQVGTQTTVYVTNFPPTADEDYIRDKFSKFGHIVDVRFPSLKYDTHRRFCYVEFKSPGEAQAATQLDGEVVEGDLKLVAKISNPNQKQKRQGAVHEGRELYVKNLDWSATTEDLSAMFSKYGSVEKVRIPRKVDGGSKGFAFVVFSNKEEAKAALDLHLTKLKSRVIEVSLATADPVKRTATTIITRASGSPQPADSGNAPSPSPGPDASQPSFEEISSRTVILLYVPDTVNDARIRAVAEPYGDLRKITLRPDHQGAILEFTDVHSAGKAALGLDGHELLPGRKLGIGTMADLKNLKADYHPTKPDSAKGAKSTNDNKNNDAKQNASGSTKIFLPVTPVRRPGQQGGRKAGLGLKRHRPTREANGDEKSQPNGGADSAGDGVAAAPKSNADFKAMFTGK